MHAKKGSNVKIIAVLGAIVFFDRRRHWRNFCLADDQHRSSGEYLCCW